jgi:hypothetical protein
VIAVSDWKARHAALLVFVAVIFLGFCLGILVGWSDNAVYPIDDLGSTSVATILLRHINPWFVLFELPFVVISVGVGLAIGTRTMSKGWKVVGGWTILALALLSVCLYVILSFLAYDWLYQLVPQNIGLPLSSRIDSRMFIQLAISNATVVSRYFWVGFGFVVVGAVTGLYGSFIAREKQPNL